MIAIPIQLVDPVLSQALGAALSVIFLSGAWQKLKEPEQFAAALENYRLLPLTTVPWVTYLLPIVEAASGALLLFQFTRLPAAFLAFFLLLLATSAVAINLLRGYTEIDCGCGGLGDGVGEQTISWGLVARNLVLMAAIPLVTGASLARELVWMDYLTVACATLGLLGVYALASQLLASQPRLNALRNS